MKTGSLFSGYGGLEMAVNQFFGAQTAWVSDIDPGACKILAHHWPGVPNLGDITAIDWAAVEPVDILTGGFPCQDLSHAGKGAGMHDGTRSGLWSHMANAIEQLRPRYVVAENVRGLLSASATSDLEPCPWCLGGSADGEFALRALGCVLGDLAELGYDAQWVGLRAADVGAPHGRFRIFIVATDTERSGWDGRSRQLGRGWRAEPAHRSDTPADANGERLEGTESQRIRISEQQWDSDCGRIFAANPDQSGSQGSESARGRNLPDRGAVADTPRNGWDEGWPEPAGIVGGSDAAERGHATADPSSERHGRRQDGRVVGRVDGEAQGETRQRERPRQEPGDRGAAPADAASRARQPAQSEPRPVAWGAYAPAIDRWARVLGRPAPAPTEASPRGSQRLAPAFVEWMQGLPSGHVTDVPGLGRNAQLKALGNGVVPQQAYAALQLMAERQVAAA